MKILVTGGAGFIGSHIVDAAIEAGHEVAVIDDLSTGDREWINPSARFYEVDIREGRLGEVFALERPEVVCHQAARANVRESLDKPMLYADVNVLGSLHILECCRRHGVRKIVYASTGGAVYGEPQVLPVTEDHPVNPLDPYGASKHHVEHYLYLYRHNFGIDFTILRYPNVYGPRQDPLGEAGVVSIFAMKMLEKGRPLINGDGAQLRDFMYVTDVVQANLKAFERGGGGIYNIGWGSGVSVNQVFDLLSPLTAYQGEKVHGSAKQGEVCKIYLDASRAGRDLNWKPAIGLEEGLRRTVEFLHQRSCLNTQA
jgi:UDP-glucose 4-epimerase